MDLGKFKDGQKLDKATFARVLNGPNGKEIFVEKHGAMHGPYYLFSPQGVLLAEAHYVEGAIDGEMRHYFHDGALSSVQRYKCAKQAGVQEHYYPSRQLKSRIPYRNGRLHGKVELFHSNGQAKRVAHFVDGKRSGRERIWRSVGQLLFEGDFKKEKPVGLHRCYHRSGKVSEEILYDDASVERSLKRWNPKGVMVAHGEQADGVYTLKLFDDHGELVREENGESGDAL